MMKKTQITLLTFVIIITASFNLFSQESKTNINIAEFDKTQINWEENTGMFPANIIFHTNTFGGRVLISKKGEVIYNIKTPVIEVFNANNILPENKSQAKVNYFIGNDKNNWETNINTYNTINLNEVWQGIDVKINAYASNIEKLFFVKPNADVSNISIPILNTQKLSVSQTGELEIFTEEGEFSFTKPIAYQDINGERNYIDINYSINKNSYGFELGNYDNSQSLVIDPLIASTYIGQNCNDRLLDIKVDNENNIYVVGKTQSEDFPVTAGAYDETHNNPNCDIYNPDFFISKFSPDLSTLYYSTFIGGTGPEAGSPNGAGVQLAINSDDNIVIVGYTQSNDYPVTSGAYDETYNGGKDGIISILTPDLSELLSSTYIGGSVDEYLENFVIDNDGNIYFSGFSSSNDYPTTAGAYQESLYDNTGNGVISKISSDLSTLLYSTYLGPTEGYSNVAPINILTNGNIIVGGFTYSSSFPVTSGVISETYSGGGDITLSIFDPNLSELLISTYLGGTNREGVNEIAIHTNGSIYITGTAQSSDFPVTPTAFQTTLQSGMDMYVCKLTTDLTTIEAATFVGGDFLENSRDIEFDSEGNIFLSGMSQSTDFPMPDDINPYQDTIHYDGGGTNYSDAAITKLNSDLTELLAATYFGGERGDTGWALAVDNDDNVIIGGGTVSQYFPITDNAFQTTYYGTLDYTEIAFLSKLDNNLSEDQTVVPTEQAHFIVFNSLTNTSVYPAWTNGNGNNRIVFIKEGETGKISLTDNTTYNINDQVGDWICVAKGTSNAVQINDLTQNTNYRLMVCEYNGTEGEELYLTTTANNNPNNFATTNTGINQIENNILISPNPSNGTFTIQNFTNSKIQNLIITNITGKIIHKSEFVIQNSQLSIQKKGIYNIQIFTKNQIINKKIIIQ